MRLTISRDVLIKPLMLLANAVEKKQNLPILSHIRLVVQDQRLVMTATDLEIELTTSIPAQHDEDFSFTIPARKFTDICKTLPEEANISITTKNDRATIRSGKGRYSVGILDAKQFPGIQLKAETKQFILTQATLAKLISDTAFAMGNQDVRYYLNGLLLEIKEGYLRAVATDGHRLALSEENLELNAELDSRTILPRKAVLELSRMIGTGDTEITVSFSSNHLQINLGNTTFTTKLIDGNYPDYNRVIPRDCDKSAVADTQLLKQTLQRTSILSNEKYRGINFSFSSGKLELLAHNPEKEEATDELGIDYEHDPLSIGFNSKYMIDVMNTVDSEKVEMTLGDANSSCLIQGAGDSSARYVVMPMRI